MIWLGGVVLMAVACGPEAGDSDDATSASATSSSGGAEGVMTDTATTLPPGSTSAGGTTAADEGTAGAGTPCGEDEICSPDQYCNWAKDSCGGPARFDTEMCTPMPMDCPERYEPACGCDGQLYDNPCFAAAAGVDLSAAGGCEPPADLYPCGPLFCEEGTFCYHEVSDITIEPDQWTCVAIPDECMGMVDCECLLPATNCGGLFECEELPGGQLEIAC